MSAPPSRSTFTSARERRLWLVALAAIVAIYSTLGLARTLSGELRARGLLDATFAVGFLMIIVAVVIVGWKQRSPSAVQVGVAIGVAAVYLMVLLRMAIPEERTHLVEYGVVALLIHQALLERRVNGRGVPLAAVMAVILTSMAGVMDELIQAVIPSRVFDPIDMLFNVMAAAMAIAATGALSWAQSRVRTS